jgi:hypothetical protein
MSGLPAWIADTKGRGTRLGRSSLAEPGSLSVDRLVVAACADVACGAPCVARQGICGRGFAAAMSTRAIGWFRICGASECSLSLAA